MAATATDRWRGWVGRGLARMERAARRARHRLAPPRRLSADVTPPKPLPPEPPSDQLTRPVRARNSHPGYGVTAETVVACLRQAEQGQPARFFDLVGDTLGSDGHLRGLVDGRNTAGAANPWVIAPGRKDKPSRLAAAELAERLPDMQSWIEHQLTHASHGPAVSETVWGLVERRVSPDRFVHVDHRRLASPSTNVPEQLGVVNTDVGGYLGVVPLGDHPGRFAVTCARGPNPYLAGYLSTAVWWAVFKRWSVRDWQVFAEMFGLPFRVGYYDDNASPATREALLAAIEKLGTDGFAVLAKSAELVIDGTARSGDSAGVFDAICNLCDAQNSKLIGGGTLVSDTGGNGSYAQAAVHAGRGYKAVRADVRRICQTFQRDIGRPYVRWNGYDGRAAAPILRVQVIEDTGLLDRANQFSTLASAFPDLEFSLDQMHEEFVLEEPAPGRGIRGRGVTAALPPGKKPEKPEEDDDAEP